MQFSNSLSFYLLTLSQTQIFTNQIISLANCQTLPLTAHTQRLFYLVVCNAAKARELEAARMWQRSFRSANSSFTTRSTFRVTMRPSSRPMPSPSTIKAIMEEKAEEEAAAAEKEQETLM